LVSLPFSSSTKKRTPTLLLSLKTVRELEVQTAIVPGDALLEGDER